jgi:thioesterase domain-containing protein
MNTQRAEQSVSPQWLQQFLHRHIPLAQAMQVAVLEVSEDAVQLCAPLGPNLNHHATVFAGSAGAVAILAAWSLLHVRLQASFPSVTIVIQRQIINYRRPIQGTFAARATLAQPAEWPRFLRLLARRGRARICVASTLEFAGQQVGDFTGDFVALDAH